MKNFTNFDDYSRKENLHFESKAVHGALGHDPFTGSVSTPIYQAATFRHRGLYDSTGFDYSRLSNPTRLELERTMAILEEGYKGYAFTSGQAANTAVFSLLNPGDEVLMSDDIYGGSYRLGVSTFNRYGITVKFVDMRDAENIEKNMSDKTRMVFLETPSNPMMHIVDIKRAAEIAHDHNCILSVDNTLMSPYFQRPLTLGADIVVHSGTKFIGGHHDTLAGLLVIRTNEYEERLNDHLITCGAQLGPMDSFLILRGIKTLPIRMERHAENAAKVAKYLKSRSDVTEVYYAGDPDHRGYDIMQKQCSGFGGMVSFSVDSPETVKRILNGVDLIYFAESLGGAETLITYPMTQTHESIPVEIRNELGITDRLLRLSVGLENADDLIADLEQAFG